MVKEHMTAASETRVAARAQRRRFTVDYKTAIVQEAVIFRLCRSRRSKLRSDEHLQRSRRFRSPMWSQMSAGLPCLSTPFLGDSLA